MQHSCYLSIINSIAGLQDRGFVFDFILNKDLLFCPQQKISLRICEFEVMEMYYFPGDRSFPHTRMVYGISAPAYNIKGILLLKGTGNRDLFPEMIDKKLKEYEFRTRKVIDNGIL